MAAISVEIVNGVHKTPELKNCLLDNDVYMPLTDQALQNIDKINVDRKTCAECIKDNIYSSLDQNMNRLERLSDVQKFYYGKNIFITGATGFLGKILVEKLLRCCPGVENLYLLVRQKRGKDIYTRIDEVFEDPLFHKLKEEVPKFRHKIVLVPGNCETAGLGLSTSDKKMLAEKVNVIFHSAATVKFDEHLRAALETNVRAPLHLIRLAKDFKDLYAFMHVSTAYSNSHLPLIEEKFYPCTADSELIHTLIEKMSDKEIDQLLPKILGPWPNTYTFTKALAEKELLENAGNVPLGIFRPAIVTSTFEEPLRCWLDNMYGPTGVSVGGATGILRTVQCDKTITADIVPVDYVVNCLMVAAYSVHNKYKNNKLLPEPPIFNYVSSVENPITWREFQSINLKSIEEAPFSNAVWYASVTQNKTAIMNWIYIIFLHFLPAALVDLLTICIGKKPKMLKVYRTIHKFSSVVSYFTTREIKFRNPKTRELWDQTSALDKQIFPFSMASLDWNVYFEEYMLGIRRYLFKESDDTIPQAKIKWKRLYYLHQIVRILFYFLILYALWSVLSILF